MPLPAPNLDDRRFQQLVDEAKLMVQQRCPEWTDHNVSDPGVTLIETFAYMVDQLLFRVNRMPERHYLRFLDLIGVRLFSPSVAHVPVTFWLSAPQPEAVLVPAGTEVATPRRASEEAVVFTTSADLRIQPCSSRIVATERSNGAHQEETTALLTTGRVACFSSRPAVGDALLVGLSSAVPDAAIAVRLGCDEAGIGVDPRHPPLRWEAWTAEGWAPCELESDGTGGLNASGDVIIHMPPGHAASVRMGEQAGWIRAVVIDAGENQPPYRASPIITGLEAFTIGATTEAVHGETVFGEVIGNSNGIPGQRFALRNRPVKAVDGAMVLEVLGPDGLERWTPVPSFADSGPSSKHFVLDEMEGEVALGPMVRQADGTARQYGAIPPKGAPMRVSAYRTGGGQRGNVSRGAISVVKSAIPFVARVENRQTAVGGLDGETVDQAMVRGPIELRSLNRAVTTSDFEELTRQAAPTIARVKALSPQESEGTTAGNAVRVLIVPECARDTQGRISLEQLRPKDRVRERISRYLDERRVVGTRVVVESATYQGITVVAQVRARRLARPADVERAGIAALYRYYDPLMGGPEGEGWPFGRAVLATEVYSVLQGVDGVEYIDDVRLFAADPFTGARGDAEPRVEIGPHSLVFSYEHILRARPAQ